MFFQKKRINLHANTNWDMNTKGIFLVIATLILLASSGMAQKKYALLVGISNYHALDKNSEWNDIHGANDINLISQELKKQKFQITVLLEKDATKSRIVTELKKLKRSVKHGSIVYIHFSMHGQPYDDALSLVKGDEVWDESLVPIDAPIAYDGRYKGNNHLVDDELNGYTEAIRNIIGKSGMIYVIIDACHAGGASKGNGTSDITRGTKRGFTSIKGKRFRPSEERPTYFNLSTKAGQSPIIYLEACKGKEINTEMKFNGKYYGPMSFFIWQTISRKPIGTDTSWTEEVKELMKKKGPQNQNMVIEKSK